MKRYLFAALLMLVCWPGAACADDIFVSNKPFKGQIYGVGDKIRFSIVDLAKALDIRLDQTTEGWFLGGRRIEVVEEHGVAWVDIDALPSDRVRVVRNKQFRTVDLYRAAANTATSEDGSWGGDATLICYGASWDTKSNAMQPTLAELERSQVVNVIYVDVEVTDAPAFKKYAFLFEGDKIPFFVLIDGSGRKITTLTGFQTYPALLSSLKRALQPAPAP